MRKFGVLATLLLVVALALPMVPASAQDGGDYVKTFDLPAEPNAEGPLAGVDPTGQTVVWWHQHSGSREEFVAGLVDEFNANNPWGITVEASFQGSYGDIYTKMIAGIPTGDVSDLVVAYQNQSLAYYQAGGLTEDLDVYVKDPVWGIPESEEADFITSFYVQDYTEDGKRIGFPPNRSLEGLFVNVTALQELGFEAPPTTWDEFREMACAFSANGWSGYDGTDATGYTVRTDASNIAAGTFANGGDIYADDQYNYNNPATAAYMQFMVDLYNEGCADLVVEAYGDQNNFTAGRALFYMGSTSGLPYVKGGIEEAYAEPFDWTVIALPYETEPVVNVYGASVSVTKTTPEKELAAWLFVRWFTESEQQAQWAAVSNYFPVRYSTSENMGTLFEEFPQYEAAWNLLQGASMVEPQIASYDVVRDESAATFENLLVGGGDVETALEELDIAANEIQASFTS